MSKIILKLTYKQKLKLYKNIFFCYPKVNNNIEFQVTIFVESFFEKVTFLNEKCVQKRLFILLKCYFILFFINKYKYI